MDYHEYWTGLADLKSDGGFEMPVNAIGIICRVVTLADDYDAFFQKVTETSEKSGLQLIGIEKPENLSDFLSRQDLAADHEIFDLLEQAEKIKENVVCGEFEYYTHFDD